MELRADAALAGGRATYVLGHASLRAALIYQHATSERDRKIAAGIDRRVAEQRGTDRR